MSDRFDGWDEEPDEDLEDEVDEDLDDDLDDDDWDDDDWDDEEEDLFAGGPDADDESDDPLDLDVDALDLDEELDTGLTEIVEVSCPYCGEEGEIAVDPVGGHIQEYVEDCEVCCQPWSVRVALDPTGGVEVEVDRLGEG